MREKGQLWWVYTCNPRYSESRDWEDNSSRSVLAKRCQLIKLGMVASTCHPSYMEGINRKIMVQANLEKNVTPYLKNN
jgi:hypothetical protein